MQSFFDWFRDSDIDRGKPWLILGKGPSFSKREGHDLDAFYTMGLNHVVVEQSVTVAHAIDIEVIEHCGETLLENAMVVVLPWIPHVRYRPLPFMDRVKFKAGDKTLDEYAVEIPILGRLANEGRLLWYNLFTSPRPPRKGSSLIRAHGFSSTAALNLLAEAGVTTVRSLGVDGGRQYSADFANLASKTLLAAGQTSYDMQFKEIAMTIQTKKVDFAPLDVETPIAIYIGTAEEQMLAVRVLEYSIRKHASMSVKLSPLYQAVEEAGIRVPVPADPKLRPRTPFSFQRFAIPALKGYRGRAIYIDSDMQVFRDIKELWLWPFDGADVLSVPEPEETGRKPQFSVMVLDCAALEWDVERLVRDLESGKWTYEEFVGNMAPAGRVAGVLPLEWNELERYSEGKTALTHYTDMSNQPWLSTENLLGRTWCEALFEAVRSEEIDFGYIRDQVDRGWVRPSLLYQLEHDVVDPLLLPRRVVQRDRREFVPPHAYSPVMKRWTGYGARASGLPQLARRTYASGRNLWVSSGLKGALRKVRNRLS